MSEPLEARVAELEARLTLQQDLLDKLSDVLWERQRDHDALAARVVALEARLAALAAGAEPGPPDESPPPHY